MLFAAGKHTIETHESFQSQGGSIRLIKDRVILEIPPAGQAVVSIDNDLISASLTGSGYFRVSVVRGQVHVTACGDRSMHLQVEGKGKVFVRGEVRLKAYTAFEVNTRDRCVADIRDGCRVKAFDECDVTTSGIVQAELFEHVSGHTYGSSRVTVYDKAQVQDQSSSAHVEYIRE